MTEEELVNQCKRQEPLAQKKLYETYYSEMKRLVMRYIKDHDDVFDCLSKGFYATLTKIDQFNYQGEGSLGAWIRRIMINESLTRLRAYKKNLFVINDDPAGVQEVSFVDVDVSHLYAAIRKLPDGSRAVFNLVAIEGYSHKETAELLKISESTSRSQLVYARNILKELIKKNV